MPPVIEFPAFIGSYYTKALHFTHMLLFLCVFMPATSQKMPDSLCNYLEELNNDIERFNYLTDQARKFGNKDLETSQQFLLWSLDLARTTRMDTLQANAYSNLGSNYLFRGDLDLALDYNLRALAIYNQYPESEGTFGALNNIGLTQMYRQKYDDALASFHRADTLASRVLKKDTLKQYRAKGVLYNNIGIIYNKINQQDKALETYIRAASFNKRINDSINLANAYSNIGLTYIHLTSYEMAETYLEQALKLRQEINDLYGMGKSRLHLGTLYSLQDRMEDAREMLEQSLEISNSINSARLRSEILKVLSELLSKQQEYKEALAYQLEYQRIKDSLYDQDTEEKITRMEMQFKFDQEYEKQQALQQEKDLRNIIIFLVLSAIVIIIFFMYRLQRSQMIKKRLALEKADLENQELALRKQYLEEQLEVRSKQLTSNVMYLLKKNELISEISHRLIALKKELSGEKKKDLHRIIFELQQGKDDEVWEEFEIRFGQVYTDFYNRLNDRFPDLTPNQKKLCAFLRLNLSSKEICALTRQSTNTLNVARTRLRRKLGLDNSDTSLVSFLEQI